MSSSVPSDQAAPATAKAQRKSSRQRKRRWALRILLAVIVVAALVAAAYWFFVARWVESTDDAYVDGNVVAITPRIPGTVVSIGADDNDRVQTGAMLVKLDPAQADVALAQAEAALAQAVRRVRGLYSTVHAEKADLAVREAALKQAQADYDRRRGLARSGAISTEEFAHAQDALVAAKSAYAASQAKLTTAQAQVSGTRIATHPDVLAAAADLRQAWLDDQYTTLVAPVSGYVAKRTVQVGQRVQPGSPLMAVVPLHQVWVDANFKETQLSEMRIGQPVTLTSDLYGDSVVYHGRIQGLGVGTGSAFSLLPAQNASGNWIKIVQRLPVRITLEAKELEDHPLRIGLSMDARVDLRHQSGPKLATQPVNRPILSTDVFARQRDVVQALIARIIRDNSGQDPAAAAAAASAADPAPDAPAATRR